jgi:lipopolysaccharide export LptBFGC system permease protein LptF
MSSCLEITALRASGISLPTLSYPLFLAACVLSLMNFTIASEMAPLTRTLAKNLLHNITRNNPFIVMQKDSPFVLKSFDFDLKSLDPGKRAEEVFCIMRQDSQERIGLFSAKELSIGPQSLHGKSISLISSVDPKFPGYDHLIIENQENMQMSKATISSHLFNTEWLTKDDLLSLREVLHKHKIEHGTFVSKTGIDLIRRIFLGLCPLTFTCIGIAFGLHIGRGKKKGAVFTAFSLAFFILAAFLIAKTSSKIPILMAALYILPQPVAILISLRSLVRISKGACSC